MIVIIARPPARRRAAHGNAARLTRPFQVASRIARSCNAPRTPHRLPTQWPPQPPSRALASRGIPRSVAGRRPMPRREFSPTQRLIRNTEAFMFKPPNLSALIGAATKKGTSAMSAPCAVPVPPWRVAAMRFGNVPALGAILEPAQTLGALERRLLPWRALNDGPGRGILTRPLAGFGRGTGLRRRPRGRHRRRNRRRAFAYRIEAGVTQRGNVIWLPLVNW